MTRPANPTDPATTGPDNAVPIVAASASTRPNPPVRSRPVGGGYVGACRGAWLAVRRPSLILPGLAAVVVFSVLMVIGTFLSAARPGGSRLTDPPTYLDDLADPGALADLTGRVVMITGACVLSIAAAHVAAAFATGTIRIQLVRQPRRYLWLAGNLTILTLVTITLTLAAVTTVLITAHGATTGYDLPTTRWHTTEATTQLAIATVNLSAALVGFALVGAALALRLRSALATIGTGLGYGLFEGLIAAVFPDATRYLPAQNLGALAQGGTPDIAYPWSIAATALVIGLAVVIAIETLHHRDIHD